MTERGLREVEPGGGARLSARVGHCGDEPEMSEIKEARQLHWAKESMKLALDKEDEADEDTFNRILWHSQRGRDDTYPDWAVSAEEEEDE